MRTARGKQSQLALLTPIERAGTAETYGIAFVDLWRLDVQPARPHDFAVDDETFKGRRGRAEHASVHFSARVYRDVHFVALADWTRARRKVSNQTRTACQRWSDAPGKSQVTSSQLVSLRGTPLIPKAYRRLTKPLVLATFFKFHLP